MAENELYEVRLRNDFYKDGFNRVVIILGMMAVAVFLLVGMSCYLYLAKPQPVTFAVGNEWRLLPDIPLDRPYPNESDLIQWVSNAVPDLFKLDFLGFKDQLNAKSSYFTNDGYTAYLAQLNNYVAYNDVSNNKSFVSGRAAGAPIIYNQGLASGRYTWEIHMPINITYNTLNGRSTLPIVVQIWVVRISTLNSMDGVSINNVVITNGQGDQVVQTRM